MIEFLLTALPFLLLIGCFLLWKRTRKTSQKLIRRAGSAFIGLLLIVAGLLIVADGVLFWYYHRPIPSNTQQVLFEGITYIRDVRHDPHPLVIHVVTVDLKAPGISFLVTPPQPTAGRQLQAQTTSQFLTTNGLQVAINADGFYPWWSKSPFDYYPHVGDPVNVDGFASSKGTVYSTGTANPTLYLSADNQASFTAPVGTPYNAISGIIIFLKDGKLTDQVRQAPYLDEVQPRTAVALDASSQKLIIVIVDGRQPNYSEGVGLSELADIVLQYGGATALNLDGGGSTTLAIQNNTGRPTVLNSPIDNRIPGRERPVANHLGIYAGKLM